MIITIDGFSLTLKRKSPTCRRCGATKIKATGHALKSDHCPNPVRPTPPPRAGGRLYNAAPRILEIPACATISQNHFNLPFAVLIPPPLTISTPGQKNVQKKRRLTIVTSNTCKYCGGPKNERDGHDLKTDECPYNFMAWLFPTTPHCARQ